MIPQWFIVRRSRFVFCDRNAYPTSSGKRLIAENACGLIGYGQPRYRPIAARNR